MKLHNRPTADLVHQAIHAMTEELALFSIKEFLIRPDGSIKMYYQVIEGTRYLKVKELAELGLMNNKFAVAGDLSWLATHTTSDEVALKALWAMVHHADVSAHQWEKVAKNGHSDVVRLRAQEQLVQHKEATRYDLEWLEEQGMTEDIKSNARLKMHILI
ncbi:MAG TPA: hypothetical protein VJ579_03130 [Candidatus Paceibacterota bacterium]|nr:hypothetical protein [Candidatus Paceibacterota bacterium]